MDNKIIVFTDGACSNNGRKNARAGIGIYFGPNDKRNISERIEGIQTNNRAELLAILEVFNILETEMKCQKNIIIYTDSKYSINCFTNWAKKWEKDNWTKKSKGDIVNLDLVKKGYRLFNEYQNVSMEHIRAHSNKSDEYSLGNNFADELACKSIQPGKTNDIISYF